MIYTTGTIAGNGNTITGTGTNFTAAGSLIRVGCTLIAFTNPVQVLQLTAITSGTVLSVTPAVSPAIAAGTKYAILLSDSLSVDGLAQDIAETFGMYQKYMSGFADVMNGAGDVTITINGKAVTVPGQKSLAKKSDLGTASGKDTGTAAGNVMMVGAFGVGGAGELRPVNGASGFIATVIGTSGWAPVNGAGTQSCYGADRIFQTWMDSANGFYARYTTDATADKTAAPWSKMQAAGTSDENWKTVNGDLDVETALDNIDRMEFKRFVYIDDESQSERRGVIAQQIEQIDPQYVHNAEKSGRYTLDLNPLVLDALAAIKALYERDIENKARIETLETELSDLKELVTSLSSNLHPQL